MSEEPRSQFADSSEEAAVGGPEPLFGEFGPEEGPRDRGPDRGSLNVWLYSRGPVQFQALGSGRIGAAMIHLNPSTKAAESGGIDLARGTCAFRDRPLRPEEPSYLEIRGPTYADLMSHGDQWPAQLARFQAALSYFSNLITRSDYVTAVLVRQEIASQSPAYPARWVARWDGPGPMNAWYGPADLTA
jgi:hypothetical protein